MSIKKYKTSRNRIRVRIRSKVKGTGERPRLSVFRSGKHIFAQIIDDNEGKTLFAASDLKLNKKSLKKVEKAREVGICIAKEARAKKIKHVVFDRGGYKFHGRVKALAEGAREGGLKF